MTTPHRVFHRCNIPLTLLAFATLAMPMTAQRVTVAGGYSSMPGRVGAFESDHGLALRLGLDLRSGSRLNWSVEGGLERLNEVHSTYTTSCILPTQATGNCHFDSRERDNGWSLGTLLRYSPGSGSVRPYALGGVGVLCVRTHGQQSAVGDNGASLPNFAYDGVTTDGALQLHLGGGIATRPTGFPATILLEARASRLFYNYSGGLQWGWNPTVTVGIRTGG